MFIPGLTPQRSVNKRSFRRPKGLTPVTETALHPILRPVPGVAEPAADPRQAILAQARRAFVEKGFDGASMQDLARAAGMSAGNFYRYFPSKAAIVEALVTREVAVIHGSFSKFQNAVDPLQTVREVIQTRIAMGCDPDSSLWAEIMAAAQRRPEIASALRALETAVVGHILQLLALLTALPQDEVNRRYTTHAAFLVTVVRGAEIGATLSPVPNPALTEMVVTHVHRLIADIMTESRAMPVSDHTTESRL